MDNGRSGHRAPLVKLAALAMLMLTASGAQAQWTRVGSVDEADVYADLWAARKQDNMVKMWSMFDHKTVQHWGDIEFLSYMSQEQYDCDERRQRTLYFSMYSENMGGGQRVYSKSDPGKWGPMTPGSIIEKLWKIACKQ